MAAALPLDPPARSPVHAPPASAGRKDKATRSHLRDRAFTLYCQGHRSPAIATQLGVSERTVRFWIAAARADIQAESPTSRAELLADAVAGVREILSAAWQGYERDIAVQADLHQGNYDYVTRRRIQRVAANPYDSTAAEYEDHVVDETYARPRIPDRAPAYLRLALDANRNIVRLLGLYGCPISAPAPTPTSGSNLPSAAQPRVPAIAAIAAIAAMTATTAAPPSGSPHAVVPTPHPRFSAKTAATATATAVPLGSAHVAPAAGALPVMSTPPAAMPIPAKTATLAFAAPTSPLSGHLDLHLQPSRLPSAALPSSGFAAPFTARACPSIPVAPATSPAAQSPIPAKTATVATLIPALAPAARSQRTLRQSKARQKRQVISPRRASLRLISLSPGQRAAICSTRP